MKKYLWLVLVVGSIFVMPVSLSYSFIKKVNGYPSDDWIQAQLWKGIVAEAVDDGRAGMYAVACVVRNRVNKGLPLGLVAMKRRDLKKFCCNQSEYKIVIAKEVVHQVFEHKGEDITGGATHFENIQKYGKPQWAYGMKKTVKIGCHTFYRKKRR
jgi:hypothetical protein